MARLTGNTMINIKSRMNLSVNKRRYMTHDMNSFVVYFPLFLLTFQQYSTIKTADARKKREKKNRVKENLIFIFSTVYGSFFLELRAANSVSTFQ